MERIAWEDADGNAKVAAALKTANGTVLYYVADADAMDALLRPLVTLDARGAFLTKAEAVKAGVIPAPARKA